MLLNAEESNALSSTSPLCICNLTCILRRVTLHGHSDKTLTEIDLEEKSVHGVFGMYQWVNVEDQLFSRSS